MSAAKIFIAISSLSIIATFIVVGAIGINILVYSFTGENTEPIDSPVAVETVSVSN